MARHQRHDYHTLAIEAPHDPIWEHSHPEYGLLEVRRKHRDVDRCSCVLTHYQFAISGRCFLTKFVSHIPQGTLWTWCYRKLAACCAELRR